MKIGVKNVTPCSGAEGIDVSSDVPASFFTGEGPQPDISDSADTLRRLGHPFYALFSLDTKSETEYLKAFSPPVGRNYLRRLMVNTMVHELFHTQQGGKSNVATQFESDNLPAELYPKPDWSLCDPETGYGCRIPSGCLQSKKWMLQVKEEIEDFRKLFRRWDLLTDEDLKEITTKVTTRRGSGTTATTESRCWNAARSAERFEGTANYFVSSLARNADENGFDETLLFGGIDAIRSDRSALYSDGREFFYFSGALLCRVMERLDPSLIWQSDIQKGASVDEAFRELVTSGSRNSHSQALHTGPRESRVHVGHSQNTQGLK